MAYRQPDDWDQEIHEGKKSPYDLMIQVLNDMYDNKSLVDLEKLNWLGGLEGCGEGGTGGEEDGES